MRHVVEKVGIFCRFSSFCSKTAPVAPCVFSCVFAWFSYKFCVFRRFCSKPAPVARWVFLCVFRTVLRNFSWISLLNTHLSVHFCMKFGVPAYGANSAGKHLQKSHLHTHSCVFSAFKNSAQPMEKHSYFAHCGWGVHNSREVPRGAYHAFEEFR